MRNAREGEQPSWDAERVRHAVESAPDDFYFGKKRCHCGWMGEATVWLWSRKEQTAEGGDSFEFLPLRLLWKCPECQEEHVWERKEERL